MTPAAALTTTDIAALARRHRVLWNALRLMLAPLMLMSASLGLFVIMAAGDPAKQRFLEPIRTTFADASILIWLCVALTWLAWWWIGSFRRVPAVIVVAGATVLVLTLALGRGSYPIVETVKALIAGAPIAADAPDKLLTLALVEVLPIIAFVVALIAAFGIVAGAWPANAAGGVTLGSFARLIRERRQGYRKFNFWRLPLVAGAIASGALTVVVLGNLFRVVISALITLPSNVTDTVETFTEYAKQHPGSVLLVSALEFLGYLLTLAAIVFWIRFGWRAIRRRATDVLADPAYRPVVFLRSFRDEDAKVKPKNPYWSLLGASVRLEEVVARQLATLGPTVAIGVPGEWAPRLGAMRAYFADDDWQGAIRTWTERAALVVVMAGASPSVRWEIDHLIKTQRTSAILMVLPPDETASARSARWIAVRDAFAGTRWQQSLAVTDPGSALCIAFAADGAVVEIDGWAGHQVDYEVAVQLTAARMMAPGWGASGSA